MSTRRLTFAALSSLLSLSLLLILAGEASAYATPEGPPIYSTAPGLPDGRVYELVSPPNKNGNQAGASTVHINGQVPGEERYGVASAEGDSVLFEATGPMGETAAPNVLYFVATRSGSGWTTRSVLPRLRQSENQVETLKAGAEFVDSSPDLTHALIESSYYTLAPLPNEECGMQIYLTGSDPFSAATWLERPETTDPVVYCSVNAGENGVPVGGSPNLSTAYFTYPGTLLPEDAMRISHAQQREGPDTPDVEAWGFYEYSQGVLREAGILPSGGLDQFGAVPAVSGHGVAFSGNQVSADGSRAFFVSPDPESCEQKGGVNNCTLDPPELYVREDGKQTLLVSRDTLSPEAGGLPASAPDGVLQMPNPIEDGNAFLRGSNGSYVFASRDGSQAFYQSEDRLTAGAPEGPPGNTSSKTYDFDVDTGTLTYLPNVVGRIVGASENGSSMVFVRPAVGSSPAELDIWSAGSAGGSVTAITQLPAGEGVEPVRVSTDSSVVVFMSSELPGFNDVGAQQIFRYDASAHTLGCVSCAPTGVPASSASISVLREKPEGFPSKAIVDERGMSSDGNRVFFQTKAPLVPQDTNTDAVVPGEEHEGVEPQGEDVYEWESGVVYLISTGKSGRNSYFLDNSESGNDVFFSTSEDLVPGDTDGGYSVFDARVPRPGDNPPPAAVPCQGSVCQGPPQIPSPLGAPASATFSGLGNVSPEPTKASVAKAKQKSKAVRCRKGSVKRKGKCVKARPSRAKKSTRGSK